MSLWLSLWVALFFLPPSVLLFALSRANRNAWGPAPPVVVPAGNDGYRSAPVVVPGAPLGAPRLVKAAAWASFALGQMFIPGLLAGMYGIVMMGIGLVSIPGLIIAARCFWSGVLLMRRAPGAAQLARSTALWSTVLNVTLVVGCLTALLVTLDSRDKVVPFLATFTLLYALVSLGHAWLLRAAADVVERGDARGEAAVAGASGVGGDVASASVGG